MRSGLSITLGVCRISGIYYLQSGKWHLRRCVCVSLSVRQSDVRALAQSHCQWVMTHVLSSCISTVYTKRNHVKEHGHELYSTART